jgi:hypothetical protein
MYLVQLLLPAPGDPEAPVFEELKKSLARHFGGFTAYTQAPAEGMWAPEAGREEHDDIVVVEVMTETLDRVWWRALRLSLEADLKQDVVIIRAQAIEML